MNYYIHVLKNYTKFDGRASRAEYWYFILFNILALIALSILDSVMGTYNYDTGNGTLSNIYQLAVLIPSIAVGIRRMHDVDKSGWFILIPIYNLILSIRKGNPGKNQYGPAPKQLN